MKFGKRVDYSYDVDGANRRRRLLLLEFLQERISQRNAEADQEETPPRNMEIETQNHHQVTLSDDLIFKILILLPADSLFTLQFLCKKWFDMINSSVFVRFQARKSETVLICKKSTLLQPAAEGDSQSQSQQPKSYFQFLDLNDGDSKFIESNLTGSVHIHASCDGLILAIAGKRKSLILMNPITRNHVALPLGRSDSLRGESFGIAFCKEANTYKIVHLFRESISGHIGCEILDICSRKWSRIEGPSSDSPIHIKHTPLSIGGSFYWFPNEVRNDYFVSMSLKDEVFVAKKLPVRFVTKDRLMEIDGDLGFVTHAQPGVLQVWVLSVDDGLRESWTNRYVVELIDFDVAYPIPVCCSRNGRELVLGSSLGSDMYVYNFQSKVVRSTYDEEAWFQSIDECYIPHTHTLVTWELGVL